MGKLVSLDAQAAKSRHAMVPYGSTQTTRFAWVLGEYISHSGQHVKWVKKELTKAGAWAYKGPLLIIY